MMQVSNIGFITVHGLNEGHIAQYHDAVQIKMKEICATDAQ